MTKLKLVQMEAFAGGRECNEYPMETELQLLMCEVQAEEDLNDLFIPIEPTNVNSWLVRIFRLRY